MVVGAFPAAKLGVLAFKQLSKPIANIIKDRAKHSPFFRQYICMPPAQFYNWMEVKTKMWVLNLGKPTNVPQLNESMAIDLGANLLGEVIIFTLGAGILIFEYVRQSKKDQMKEELIIQRKMELDNTIHNLIFQVEKQDAQIREMYRTIAELESRTWLPKKLRILEGNKSEKPSATPPPPSPTPPPPPPSAPSSLNESENVNSPLNTTKINESQQNVSGNYNPEDGLLFKALHLIETEVFYSDSATDKPRHLGIIPNALIYLNLNIYE